MACVVLCRITAAETTCRRFTVQGHSVRHSKMQPADLQHDGAGAAGQHAFGREGTVKERHGDRQRALDGVPPCCELGAALLWRRAAPRQQRVQERR